MITYIDAGPRFSQIVVHNKTVYLSGQVASDPSGDVVEQTRQILASIDQLLRQAGTDKSNVLTASIFLSDISTYPQMNAVWDSWVVPGRTPARVTTGAPLAAPEYRVEIVVTAAIP